VKYLSKRVRWLDRRILVALIASTGIVATAVYTTSTNTAQPRTVQAVAEVQNASAPFTCDFQGLIQQAQQLSLDPGNAVAQIKDLLASCGIDTSATEQFLQQAAADADAASPQLLTADAKQFLVRQQGVAPDDFDQLQVELGQVMEDPAQVGKLAGDLLGKVGKYGLVVAAAIAVVAIALIVFGATSSGDQEEKRPACDENALKQALFNTLPQRVAGDPTTGFGIDATGNHYQFESGNNKEAIVAGQPTMDGYLVNAAKDRLRQQGMPDATLRANHAEPKMATYMNLNGIDEVCMVINNVDGPCPRLGDDKSPIGCFHTVPVLLGRNQQGRSRLLTVFWMDKAIGWTYQLFAGK